MADRRRTGGGHAGAQNAKILQGTLKRLGILFYNDGRTYSWKLLVFRDFMFGSDLESPSWFNSQ